ncbi:pyridoxal phosphate-dependent aminotransferase [Methylosarcina fibrata]|uniref:pyridoxal phosphate-dependent aminotransferase n=1 Tax=Methylosarcina fibrata TaxID=105972 RepID=UPI000374C5AC|nr:pyridoxal phosphate-dependent aminotransferase [Methylosarcina fibrata]
MRSSRRMTAVQAPIIPVVGEWTRNTPGALSLGQGMVSYPPPPAALQAVREFGEKPEHFLYGPASGSPFLLEMIGNKLQTDNGIDTAGGYRVMVTAGSNMAFLSSILAIADPGDEIILPLPYYFNHEMAIRMANCEPVFVPTGGDYQLDLDALATAINEKTRAVVTVSPNNPSGAVYPEAALRAVNALCREHGIYHVSDEAYEYFTYDGAAHFSPGSIPGAEASTISLYSLSKAYGFAGWRIGYAVYPEHLHSAFLKIQDTNLICAPGIAQHAAAGALSAGSAYCKRQLRPLAEVRSHVIGRLEPHADLCDFTVTQGAFYFLLQLHTEKNDLAVVESLIRDFKIATIPGSAFGLKDGCYLRLSYGMLNPALVDEAMDRLIRGIRRLV